VSERERERDSQAICIHQKIPRDFGSINHCFSHSLAAFNLLIIYYENGWGSRNKLFVGLEVKLYADICLLLRIVLPPTCSHRSLDDFRWLAEAGLLKRNALDKAGKIKNRLHL